MMEFIAGMVTGYVLTWPALLGIVVLALFFEHSDSSGWAVFFGLVAMVMAYFTFSVPLTTLLMIAGGYTIAGLLWSFWRYKRFVSSGAKKAMQHTSVTNKEYALEQLKASKNLWKITTWFVIWPISLIENLTGDIINAIQTLITDTFHRVYESIWNSSTGEAYAAIAKQKAAEKARDAAYHAEQEAKKSGAIIVGDKDISK